MKAQKRPSLTPESSEPPETQGKKDSHKGCPYNSTFVPAKHAYASPTRGNRCSVRRSCRTITLPPREGKINLSFLDVEKIKNNPPQAPQVPQSRKFCFVAVHMDEIGMSNFKDIRNLKIAPTISLPSGKEKKIPSLRLRDGTR